MSGKFLDIHLEASGSWRRLEKKFGTDVVSKHLDNLLRQLAEMTEEGLRAEYDRAFGGIYNGHLRGSVFSKRTGARTFEAGLDLHGRGSRHSQNLYIYGMSQLKGWNPSPMSMARIIDRIQPWVKRTFGYSGRQARAAAVGIVRKWLSEGRHPGKNFVGQVLRIPATGSGLSGVFVGDYYNKAVRLHEQALKNAKDELEKP